MDRNTLLAIVLSLATVASGKMQSMNRLTKSAAFFGSVAPITCAARAFTDAILSRLYFSESTTRSIGFSLSYRIP